MHTRIMLFSIMPFAKCLKAYWLNVLGTFRPFGITTIWHNRWEDASNTEQRLFEYEYYSILRSMYDTFFRSTHLPGMRQKSRLCLIKKYAFVWNKAEKYMMLL